MLPLTALTSGRALRAIAIGTGNTPSIGGTVLWETHASGAVAVLVFRVAPIAVSLVLSWWVARRLGAGALQPVPLDRSRLGLAGPPPGVRGKPDHVLLHGLDGVPGAARGDPRLRSSDSGRVARCAVTVVVCRISDRRPSARTRWGVYVQNDLIPLFIGAPGHCLRCSSTWRAADDRRKAVALGWLSQASISSP